MAPGPGPINPFLAASGYPIAHGRSDQQDNSPVAGPTGPTGVVPAEQVQYRWLGPGHFGSLISGPYPDGGRVIWSNGREQIAKLDYETLEVLASVPVDGRDATPVEDLEAAVDALDRLEGEEAIEHAIGLAMVHMTGLDGVYALLDRDHTLFLGRRAGAVAYRDADPADRSSAIVEVGRWDVPDEIEGSIVGVNMTFDGRLVMTTDHGWVICLERDFSSYEAVRLPGATDAAAHNARMVEEGRAGYGWVRTSCCVDEDGGIYVSSVDHTHRVVWTGGRLSLDEADGAWSAAYRNGTGLGSGTTPSLMGFGPDADRFVVIGDGDDVVNITLLWRDEIPEDWERLPDAPSRRIAGVGPADMGDRALGAIQTEQSITVSGYGAMTVNNEPASIPADLPDRGRRLLVFYLGHDPAYTPRGLHKYEWDPQGRVLREAWVNTDVSSPNSVPFVSEGSGVVYTCGVRDGRWTIEGLDWTTGAEVFHAVLGGSRFNTLGAGVMVDEEGRLLFGTMFGKARLLLPPVSP